ncbi:hypothetical protein HMPREF9144_0890 [Prevotella pallens ATCC 700821]|uniref:Uncharacterized protein n=1 Tax=Prevotella pallens ATCC 700821 TaxID=997353 RepID=F9DGV0_9BACT|nr:hypothetical protein HMPREF9144_0890 [Prevotella pallens ATCC 700821]
MAVLCNSERNVSFGIKYALVCANAKLKMCINYLFCNVKRLCTMSFYIDKANITEKRNIILN